ncbi:hypothetical protein [Bacillus altitudinis]|uniref:hypothetical protein n=1 Tax=Bacillus altitudinis TaxID=293387 RepID=UPI002F9587D2
MTKDEAYKQYLNYIQEYYPKSSFLKIQQDLSKKLFSVIHTIIGISEIFSTIEILNTTSKKLLLDQKIITIKTLYILPNSDDFQFFSIMRANVENLLRILLLAFKTEMNYKEIKETSYLTLSSELKETYINQKYKRELSDISNYFGSFSKNIHNISIDENPIIHLKQMMVTTVSSKSVEGKIKSLVKVKNILINVFLDIYKLESRSFDTAQLTRLHSILGEEEYSKLPIFM